MSWRTIQQAGDWTNLDFWGYKLEQNYIAKDKYEYYIHSYPPHCNKPIEMQLSSDLMKAQEEFNLLTKYHMGLIK